MNRVQKKDWPDSSGSPLAGQTEEPQSGGAFLATVLKMTPFRLASERRAGAVWGLHGFRPASSMKSVCNTNPWLLRLRRLNVKNLPALALKPTSSMKPVNNTKPPICAHAEVSVDRSGLIPAVKMRLGSDRLGAFGTDTGG
ncbi:hypothetical protein L596_018058 [Steinernema carpocapsae]|uniref:Uncharacterized protein n=1 Tax=Steinernema carpocapsae TaxID=34508 RepID=A0A4V6A1X5_STECR|nr:hypothetical protein L596_018058 [Steinernema carpocapsae]